jgi:Ser/Thr protein kinase RdoA (MazF antagonist)
MSVAAQFGVRCTEPVVLADGANVIVHLEPSPVVAKVAASTQAVRPDISAWLERELAMARFLARAGAPVMAPSGEVPATVHHGGGHVMSFWTYLRRSAPDTAGEEMIGSMLRDLHALLREYPHPPPVLTALGDIPAFLARPQTLFSASDIAVLAETFSRLTADLAAVSAGHQVLHGDAGVGNLMMA